MDHHQKWSTLPYSSMSLKYHRYPIDHTIYQSYWADLYVILRVFPWETAGTGLYMKSPFPLDCTQTWGRYLQEKFHLSSSSSWLFAHEAPTAPYGTYIQLPFWKLSLVHMGWFSLIFPAHYPLTTCSSNSTTNEPPPALSNRIMDWRLEI